MQMSMTSWLKSAVFTGALSAAVILSACAQSPESVTATPVSSVQYQGLPCATLGHRMAGLDQRIAVLSTEQRTKRVNDVVGWIFRLQPDASIRTTDIRPQLALAKGERQAVEQAMTQQCSNFRS